MPPSLLLIFAIIPLIILAVWPQVDLAVSGLFYTPDKGFVLATNPVLLFLRDTAFYGARFLGSAFLLLALWAWIFRKDKKTSLAGLNAKAFAFLFLALLLGPALISNVGFKDHWGRARPREIVAFGGTRPFSPALIPQANGHKNSSFVSGDASFGFFLPAFAYIAPRRFSRRVFWGAVGMGSLFSLARLVMGAHFLSDIFYAAFFVLSSTAALHAFMYGRAETKRLWREWFFTKTKPSEP